MGLSSYARRRWQQLGELSGAERRTLLQALALLPLATVGRHVLSYRRLRSLLGVLLPSRAASSLPSSESWPRAERVARVVQIAARHSLLRPNCLDRSLVLWALLRRRGIESTLRFGTRKDGARFEAHAWVELEGVVLNDTADVGQRFAAF